MDILGLFITGAILSLIGVIVMLVTIFTADSFTSSRGFIVRVAVSISLDFVGGALMLIAIGAFVLRIVTHKG